MSSYKEEFPRHDYLPKLNVKSKSGLRHSNSHHSIAEINSQRSAGSLTDSQGIYSNLRFLKPLNSYQSSRCDKLVKDSEHTCITSTAEDKTGNNANSELALNKCLLSNVFSVNNLSFHKSTIEEKTERTKPKVLTRISTKIRG